MLGLLLLTLCINIGAVLALGSLAIVRYVILQLLELLAKLDRFFVEAVPATELSLMRYMTSTCLPSRNHDSLAGETIRGASASGTNHPDAARLAAFLENRDHATSTHQPFRIDSHAAERGISLASSMTAHDFLRDDIFHLRPIRAESLAFERAISLASSMTAQDFLRNDTHHLRSFPSVSSSIDPISDLRVRAEMRGQALYSSLLSCAQLFPPPPPQPPSSWLSLSGLSSYHSHWRTWVACGALASVAGAFLHCVGSSAAVASISLSGSLLFVAGLAAIGWGLWLRHTEDPYALLCRFLPSEYQTQFQNEIEQETSGPWHTALRAISHVPLSQRAQVIERACSHLSDGALSLADWIHLFQSCSSSAEFSAFIGQSNPHSLSFSSLQCLAQMRPVDYQNYLQRITSSNVHRRLNLPNASPHNALYEIEEEEDGQVGDPNAEDKENVMDAGRIGRARDCFAEFHQWYQKSFGQIDESPVFIEQSLNAMTAYIENHWQQYSSKQKLSIQRVIYGPPQRGDYCAPLATNPAFTGLKGQSWGLGTLVGLIWRVAETKLNHPSPAIQREGETMVYTFLCNLADCIESDGHAVCSVGVTQRLLTTLGGYVDGLPSLEPNVPTPDEVLSHLWQSFQPFKEEEPGQDELTLFCARSEREALRVWPGDHLRHARAEFQTKVRDALQMSYDFHVQ